MYSSYFSKYNRTTVFILTRKDYDAFLELVKLSLLPAPFTAVQICYFSDI